MDESLAAQAGVMPAEQLSVLRGAVRRAFAGDALRESVRSGLLARYDVRGAAGTLAWLRSPLGRRITQLEELGASQQMSSSRPDARSLAAAPPAAARIALIRELQESSGVADVGVDLAMTAALALALGANAAQPDAAKRADEAAITAAIQAQRAPMAGQIEAVMQISSLFTYRELSDEELATYLEFVQSDAGRWYHDAVVAGLVSTLRRAASGIGGEVGPGS